MKPFQNKALNGGFVRVRILEPHARSHELQVDVEHGSASKKTLPRRHRLRRLAAIAVEFGSEFRCRLDHDSTFYLDSRLLRPRYGRSRRFVVPSPMNSQRSAARPIITNGGSHAPTHCSTARNRHDRRMAHR